MLRCVCQGDGQHCQHSCETRGMPGTAWAVGTECQCQLACSCTLPGCLGRTQFLCCPWSHCPRITQASQQLWAQCSCPKAALTLPAGVLLSQWISATSTIRKEMHLSALQLQPTPSEHLPGVCLPPQTALSVGCSPKPCFPSLPSAHSSHGPTSASQCPGQPQGKGAED